MQADLTSFITTQLNALGFPVFGAEARGDNLKTYCFKGHDRKTPSLSIRKTDGAFLCFGCGVKGRNWNDLAVHLNADQLSDEDMPDPFSLMHKDLDRRIKKSIVDMDIPWDVEPWVRSWRNLSTGFLRAIGALRWYDDMFKCERILWPVMMYGKLEGWVARRTDEAAPGEKLKVPYYNAPTMSSQDVLFPFDFTAKMKRKSVVLVEGPYDSLRLLHHRIPALSILGTKNYHTDNGMHLLNMGVETIIIAMDGDEAGDAARLNIAIEIKRDYQDFEVKHFHCPRKEDPGSMGMDYIEALKELTKDK